ncbi:chemotaxis protein CheV [Moritella marina ATCC 15381]|uniref:Chemotaxis protein CheV n=1 Tax=Moritella marina ATCC 15381 TaxID=1202962 RepID=A0A5J6WL40_MORMI|nr:chemotaxis protein [Moritella marina]QFI38829.1 chemotaxis protein CheV [Moritella marina ATCC 15381]
MSQSQGLLLFKLNLQQKFAIGTLKVQEIVPSTRLYSLPGSHPMVMGAATLRGKTIPIIDMASAVGYRAVTKEEYDSCNIIITDCSRQVVGFLVRHIDKIMECSWKDISAPSATLGCNIYTTGVMHVDDKLVQLMDVERLLADIYPDDEHIELPQFSAAELEELRNKEILVVDDSMVARNQLGSALDAAGIHYQVSKNGQDALTAMQAAVESGKPIDVLVSDIEMPGLDGYEVAFEVRSTPNVSATYIILHTSLSSMISTERAQQIGADEALTKFDASELLQAILRGVKGRENIT